MKNYYCPMHPEVKSKKPGKCTKCGMNLVRSGSGSKTLEAGKDNNANSYKALWVIVGLIILATASIALKDLASGIFSWEMAMSYFMAGFFLVFSGFKLLDLRGFADGYSTYDLIAMRLRSYGYVYPFIELLLGIGYIHMPTSIILNVFTFVLMTFSGLGVAIKLAKKEEFQCSCLGTFIKVPLTKVTLVEDFGMAIMALLMLK